MARSKRHFASLLFFSQLLRVSIAGLFWSTPKAGEEKGVRRRPFEPDDFGVDCSFPIHHQLDTNDRDPTLRHWATHYAKMIQGCYDLYSFRECDSNERARIEMNYDQPANQHNYTKIGFKHMRAPKEVWDPLIAWWNEHKTKEAREQWPRGNTYVNNWEVPSYMVSFEDAKLQGGLQVKDEIWGGVKPILEEWTGKELTATSLYGIRVYKDGAVLATHVDRLPLVTSAIIQVAQDVDEPWPVEVYSHDGKAYNVTMKPGDMVLYESHTVLHGRPYPLKGRFYANVFVHFIPIDHDEENKKDGLSGGKLAQRKKAKEEAKAPPAKKVGGHEHDQHDEETLRRHRDNHDRQHGSKKEEEEEEEEGEEQDDDEEEEEVFDEEDGEEGEKHDGRSAIHVLAAQGDLDGIEHHVRANADIVHVRDANEWQPIHEAARGGHLDVLKYLVDLGSDIGAKTSNGGTSLWWAKRSLPKNHEVILYLESIGAPDASEDL